jgi:hypothetical protein
MGNPGSETAKNLANAASLELFNRWHAQHHLRYSDEDEYTRLYG